MGTLRRHFFEHRGCYRKNLPYSRLWQRAKPIAVSLLRRRTFFAFGKKEFSSKYPSPTPNKKPTFWSVSVLVGEGGFEPPKLKAADLQSVPFGHSGTLPYSVVAFHSANRIIAQGSLLVKH